MLASKLVEKKNLFAALYKANLWSHLLGGGMGAEQKANKKV